MQRDEKLGTPISSLERNSKRARRRFARQEEQDNADFFARERGFDAGRRRRRSLSRRRRTGSSAATRSIKRR